MKRYKGFIVYEKGIRSELEESYPKYTRIKEEDCESGVTRFIKLVNIVDVDEKGKQIVYTKATRTTKIDDGVPDAVSVLPYFVINGNVYFLIGNQYRPNIKRRELSLFAGLVDKNDVSGYNVEKGIERAVARELKEESGEGRIIKIMPITGIMNKSAGFSDESEQTFLAEIRPEFGSQTLDYDEDIFNMIVSFDEIEYFLEEFSDTSPVCFNALSAVLGLNICRTFIAESLNSSSGAGV